SRTSRHSKQVVGVALSGAVLCAPLAFASSAQADSDSSTASTRSGGPTVLGLYGAQDPVYNAAFRQGFAILGLKSAKAGINSDALTWLTKQQCSNGSWSAYRSDLSVPCAPPNPDTYSGSDSNSTSMGAAAFAVAGKTKKMNRAISWLRARQNSDGGWAYYSAPGATSDANSTGLVVLALAAAGKDPSKVRRKGGKSAAQYLRSVQKRCSASADVRGGLRFQKVPPPDVNNLASAQVSLGLLPLVKGTGKRATVTGSAPKIRKGSPILDCTKSTGSRGDVPSALLTTSTRGALLGYLSKTIKANAGSIPSAYGSGPDVGSTANAVTALAAAGYGRSAVNAGLRTLKQNSGTYLVSPSQAGPNAADPGALAYYILAAQAAGKNPRNFGGINLVSTLKSTMQR
ncbi:MAG: prenyltransferase/squalene oxidase repeat-containing protein, partial [Candidatus Nanopelagicales bacterium]